MPLVDLGPATPKLVDLGPVTEDSIANAKGLTVDEIMSKSFDMEKHIGVEQSQQLDTISNVIPKQELLSDLQIDSLLKANGSDNESLEARRIALMSAVNENTSQGTFAAIKEGWNNNQIQMQISDTRLAQMNGRIDDVQAERAIAKLKSQIKDSKAKGFSSWAKSAANMAPMMLETSGEGAKYGLVTGGAAAGIALAAGQAGPQVALPEEAITVPGAALTWGALGFSYGSAKKGMEIETGLMYDELLDMKDDKGDRIDPVLAANVSQSVGVINGMLELVQIGDIIKTIPGGKKLLAKAQRKTVESLIKNRSIQQAVLGGLKKWAGHIGVETSTEVAQETTNIVFDELAKNINNEMQKTGFAPASIKDITNRLVDTAKESAKAFTLISAPGNIVHTSMEATQAAKTTPTKPVDGKPVAAVPKSAPITPGVPGPTGEPSVGISRVMSSERIIPRVDINSLGKTMVDLPTELPNVISNELSEEILSKTLSIARKELVIPETENKVQKKVGESGYVNWAVNDILEDDAHGILVGVQNRMDRIFDIRPEKQKNSDPETVYDSFRKTREYLKKTFGDNVILYRAQSNEDIIADKNTLLYATKNEALKYKTKGRRLIEKSVDIDDIVAVFSTPDGKYHEFVVINRKSKHAKLPENLNLIKKPVQKGTLTPEEDLLLKQSEATLAAESEFTITPELYIGNVTQRAKEVMGEAFGVDPEAIQGFHEGAWPTKRTKITLTMDEGRGLLTHMESSLQNRVDNNLLKNDSDLSRANADWGDIKELRKKLGLPKTLRPFIVVREKGTRMILIENTRERINKTTKSGAQDMVETTKIQQLNDVMRRVAKYAKEGFVAGKKEMRESYQLLRYLQKQKQLREKLIDRITAEPSENVDFFYRQAIAELQEAVDWQTTTPAKQEKKAASKQALERTPENYMNAPEALVKSFSQKEVADLSYNDLMILNEEINRLKEAGKLKSGIVQKQRKEAIKQEAADFAATIQLGKVKGKFWSFADALTLKPMRIFDMLDGGKDFKGRMYKFFYEITNQNHNVEMQNADNRLNAGKQKMSELGIDIKHLTEKRKVGDNFFTVDEMLTVYAGWKNWAHQQKLRFGGIKTDFQEKPVEISDQLYSDMMEELSENDKLWADTVIAEYQQNSYDRLRNTVIAAENRDMGREENYTPAPSADRGISSEQDMLDELSFRHYVRQIGPAKGFTIERKDIPPQYQNAIRSGLTKLWFESVSKQEHYINNALHVKDMQAMLKQKELSEAIRDKFGDSMMETVTQFVSRIANPDFYKQYNELNNISRVLRKNAAMAYISWNFSSVFNQVPAIMSYWVNSSAMDVISAAMDAVNHPMQAFERAKALHYQISHVTIEREMIELEMADRNAFEKIVNTIGRTGMYGLFAMDRAVRVIGINAVYNYQIRQGLSPQEAQNKAVQTTLMTQEAAAPKDLARLWATDEKLNWLLMFTNQLNQIYNTAAYDIPSAYRNKNYREAGRSAISLATMAMMIWMIQNGRLPEDEEDALDALADQSIAMLPLIGSWINAQRNGWDTEYPFQTIVKGGTKGVTKLLEGDLEKAVENMAEPLALTTGFPYQGAKEAYKFIEESE